MFGKKEKASVETSHAIINSLQDTGVYINNLPQLEFEITLFPKNGPMVEASFRQQVPFSMLGSLKPGVSVIVAYDTDLKHMKIEGLNQYIITGEPFDLKTIEELMNTIKISPIIAKGRVTGIKETGTFVNDISLYRINACFYGPDGSEVEGETLKVCRPWFYNLMKTGDEIGIIYYEKDPSKFTVTEPS